MKIVMVSNHSCIRVHKMSLPLVESGRHKVHLIAHKHASFAECYKTFGHWLEMGQLNNLIQLHAPTTDVFHVHNEPSFFVTLIKESCDVPVVLDVHDSFLARTTPEESEKNPDLVRITAEERNNFQLADALVFPSKPFADLIRKEFNLKQPYIVLPSYLPRRLYRYSSQDWMGGLVYEGNVQLDDSGRASHGFRYCNYRKFAEKCHEMKMDFHLYAGRKDKPFMDIYKDISFVHEAYAFENLLKQISRHDWGLVGNIDPTPEWDVAFPNKLFEYIAASVPIVVINAKECGKFVKEYGIGIEVKSLDELGERWAEHEECRKNLIKKRVQFSMERNIAPLETLYESLRHPVNDLVANHPVPFDEQFRVNGCPGIPDNNGKKKEFSCKQ